jgi:hypothetical protein
MPVGVPAYCLEQISTSQCVNVQISNTLLKALNADNRYLELT